MAQTTAQIASRNRSPSQQLNDLLRNSGRHERTRTADPYRVKVVLYQLSYVPKGQNSRKDLLLWRGAESNKRRSESQASHVSC